MTGIEAKAAVQDQRGMFHTNGQTLPWKAWYTGFYASRRNGASNLA